MKQLISLAGVFCLAAAVSTGAIAADKTWYVGGSAASYYLDSERDLAGGDQEAVAGGVQVGFVADDGIGLELGYMADVGGDDLDAVALSIFRMIGDDDGLRPYILAGVSHFDTDLATAENNSTMQLHLGAGLSSMLTETLELRGDIRSFFRPSDHTTDLAVTLGLNYLFGVESAPAPVVEAPAPAPEPVAEPEVRTITVRLNVEFETDKDVVRAIYGDELQAVTSAMKAHEDIELVLEGHTDSRGEDAYNQDLSSRRAAAVKAKLAEDYGIAAERISTVGYGEGRPIADNDTTEGRARNRRVVGEMSYSEVAE